LLQAVQHVCCSFGCVWADIKVVGRCFSSDDNSGSSDDCSEALRVRALLGCVVLAAGSLPVFASVRVVAGVGGCGGLAWPLDSTSVYSVWDPVTGKVGTTDAFDPMLGDLAQKSDITFSPGGSGWVKATWFGYRNLGVSSIKGFGIGWKDDKTIVLNPDYGFSDDPNRRFSFVDVSQPGSPIVLGGPAFNDGTVLGTLAGRRVGVDVLNFDPNGSGEQRLDVVDLESNVVKPGFRDSRVVLGANFVGTHLLRIVKRKGVYLVQEQVGKALKTYLRSKSQLVFRSGATQRFLTQNKKTSFRVETADPADRYVAVGTAGYGEPDDGKGWLIDLQTGKARVFMSPEVGPRFHFTRVEFVQGYAIAVSEFGGPGVVLTLSGQKSVALTEARAYGPACTEDVFSQRDDLPQAGRLSWAIRPPGTLSCLGVSNSERVSVVAAGNGKCIQNGRLLFRGDLFPPTLSLTGTWGPGSYFQARSLSFNDSSYSDDAEWRVFDPQPLQNRFPNPQGTHPLWMMLDGVAQCLTRSGDVDGSTISMTPCGDVSPNQIWQ
jgi:hypothetical protein